MPTFTIESRTLVDDRDCAFPRAVQRDDGWIDAKPGLGGQRANVLAPPLLAVMVLGVTVNVRGASSAWESASNWLTFIRPERVKLNAPAIIAAGALNGFAFRV